LRSHLKRKKDQNEEMEMMVQKPYLLHNKYGSWTMKWPVLIHMLSGYLGLKALDEAPSPSKAGLRLMMKLL